MWKYGNLHEALAVEKARQKGLYYGMTCHDGMWYVGTEAQLKAIDCFNIRRPYVPADAEARLLAKGGA